MTRPPVEQETATGPGGAVAGPGLVGGLLDWRFRHYLTMQLLPVFYVLLVIAAVVVIAGISALAFLAHPLAGAISLVVAPFALLIAVAVIRAVLEYLVMAHRIMRVVENMERIPGHVDHLSARVEGLAGKVEDLGGRVEHMQETVTLLRPVLAPVGLPGRWWRRLLRAPGEQ